MNRSNSGLCLSKRHSLFIQEMGKVFHKVHNFTIKKADIPYLESQPVMIGTCHCYGKGARQSLINPFLLKYSLIDCMARISSLPIAFIYNLVPGLIPRDKISIIDLVECFRLTVSP
jgi:hypothetical protein